MDINTKYYNWIIKPNLNIMHSYPQEDELFDESPLLTIVNQNINIEKITHINRL